MTVLVLLILLLIVLSVLLIILLVVLLIILLIILSVFHFISPPFFAVIVLFALFQRVYAVYKKF